MSERTIIPAALVVGALILCAGCGDMEAPPNVGQSIQRDIEPTADGALRKMSDALSALDTFSFRAEGIMDEVLETGQLSQFSRRSKVLVSRPDKLRVETKGDDLSRSAWYDGQTVTVMDNRTKSYASVDAPDTIEKMFDFVVEKYGLTLPATDLLFRNSYKMLIANVTSGTYVGRHNVGDHACHHLAFRQAAIDWQIWIDAGSTPVPRKLIITYKLEPGHPSYEIVLSEWNLSPTAAKDVFAFQAPSDAEQVEMTELLGTEEGE